jgi:putative phosphoribosyl transferase
VLPFDRPRRRRRFADRAESARVLAPELALWREQWPVVLALPTGGIPVARVVARELGVTFGVRCVLKLHVPGQPDLAAGAVAPGACFLVDDLIRELEISDAYLDVAARAQHRALEARVAAYGEWHARDLRGRTVILVDDGISTGASAAAAVLSVRRDGAARVVVAAPVASRAGLRRVAIADDVVVPCILRDDCRVGDAYADFTQWSDRELLGGLRTATVAG